MNDLALALLLFAGSSALVIVSGAYLARQGDALAGLMGWSRLWVGTILVALATSLPELATNLTAATRDEPGLALGDILGSNMVNMFILGMVALAFGGGAFFRELASAQRVLISVAILMTGLALVLGVLPKGPSFREVGLGSLLILLSYAAGMRLVYMARPRETATGPGDRDGPGRGLIRVWAIFGLAALGVLLSAPTLVFSVERIAETTGLATSFLGVIAVALVTSLPEATTSIVAARLGAIDLALGNLYGSCVFNITIVAIADPFYRDGVLVEAMEPAHVAAALGAIILMGLGFLLVASRGRNRYLPAAPILVLMGLGYVGGLLVVFGFS